MKSSQRHRLDALITASLLQSEAGKRAYARGAAYFESGAVADLAVSDDTINASVQGGDEYAVQLWNDAGVLGHSCTCPVGEGGAFCKHGVAAALAWLKQQDAAPANSETAPASRIPALSQKRARDGLTGVGAWLAAAPRERLADIILEQAHDDPALRSRLVSEAARAVAREHVDLKALKETVGKALAVSGFADGNEARAARQGRRGRGFVDYYGMCRVIQRAAPAVDLIARLLEDGHADTARELAQYAVKRGIATYGRIDDSAGGFGDLLRQIAALHLNACRAAPPEPAAFGKQFFALQMLDDWGLLAFDDYAPLLQDSGLRAFRTLAENEWSKVPARGAQHADARRDTSYYRITSLMESLARQAGDVDALVAIKSRDLTSPYHFLQIAEHLAAADRRDGALDWAERGHKAFPERLDSRLIEFLASEYARRNRHDDALALAWEMFTHQSTLASYQHLKTCADRAKTWQAWCAKALAWLREDFVKIQQRAHTRWSWMPGGHSLLVEIFLWEGDSDAALAEAKTGNCTESLWFALARAREQDHPLDAAAIYRNRLEGIVGRKNNDAYDEAAVLVGKMRDLTQRAQQESEFTEWLENVRVKHKAKRNFIQRLDKIMATAHGGH